MEMIMTAGMVGADEAYRTGLVIMLCHKQKFRICKVVLHKKL
jgi:enoyl-CoA hydratase/carnithine racemase